MIKVMIRNLLDEKGIELGEFSPYEIEDTVKLVKDYGASVASKDEMIEGKYWGAQFVLDKEDRFFEIIVDPDKGA